MFGFTFLPSFLVSVVWFLCAARLHFLPLPSHTCLSSLFSSFLIRLPSLCPFSFYFLLKLSFNLSSSRCPSFNVLFSALPPSFLPSVLPSFSSPCFSALFRMQHGMVSEEPFYRCCPHYKDIKMLQATGLLVG